MCVLLCIFRTTLYLLGVLQSVALCSPFFIVCVSPFLSLLLRRLRRLRLRLLFFFVGVFFFFFPTQDSFWTEERKKERTKERKKERKKEGKKERGSSTFIYIHNFVFF